MSIKKELKKKKKEFGATLTEYALLVALIAVIGIPALKITGERVRCALVNGANGIEGVIPVADCAGHP